MEKKLFSQQGFPQTLWDEYFATKGYDDLKYSGLGISTLPLPEFCRKNFKSNSQKMLNEEFQYHPVRINNLKKAVLQYFPPITLFKNSNLEVGNIAITPGAVYGLSAIVQLLTFPGDEVILIEPIYPSHLSRLRKRNDFTLRTCPTIYDKQENIFKIDFQCLKNILNSKTKIVLICNPCNPTTNILKEDELKVLSDILEDFPNIMVVEDSAYFTFYGNINPYIPFGSTSASNFTKSITAYSAGKMFNTTGIRNGFVVAPSAIIEKLQTQQLRQIALSSSLDQTLTLDNLKDAWQSNYYEKEAKKYEQILVNVVNVLRENGYHPVNWNGTYYLIIRIEQFRGRLDNKWYKRMDNQNIQQKQLDKAFARMIFKEFSIGVLPLSGCYINFPNDSFIRLSFNRKEEDIKFMLDGFKKISKEFDIGKIKSDHFEIKYNLV